MKATVPALLLITACATSSHPTAPAELGTPRRLQDLEAVIDVPGPITLTTVRSADWAVPRSGLINLEDPAAAELEDGDEPIQVYFHAIEHPDRGTFIVDTGVERAVRDDRDASLVGGLVGQAMKAETMQVVLPLGDWLAARKEPVAGVLLTHIHLDHILGLRDVPRGTPIYAGPGETAPRALLNVFTQGITDAAFEGHAALKELGLGDEGLLDLFGDGSVWAIAAPGHTPGSVAYLARTVDGPVLLTGDACHTAWGWAHGVEPGTFSLDRPKSRASLARLKALVAAHPSVGVRFGHQPAE